MMVLAGLALGCDYEGKSWGKKYAIKFLRAKNFGK